MANWHYYNENREKIGPITGSDLKRLVQQGTVTPETFVEDPTGRTGLAKDVKGLKFADTSPVSENLSTIAVPLPQNQSIPVPLPTASTKDDVASLAAKGKELTQQGKETICKGMSEVMGGLSAVKAAAQARLKLNALKAQLVTAFRALGDVAIQAGWDSELCESIRKQKEEVSIAIAQHNKTAADVELAKNTPGARAAKQVLSEAKTRMTLAAGILDGLREKAGRTLLNDTSAPSHIGTEQRAEIARLLGEFSECESIIAHGKKSLVSKPMLVAAGILLLLLVLGFMAFSSNVCLPPRMMSFWSSGHPFKNAKPGDWARYDVTVSAENKTENMTLLFEVLSNDGKKVKLHMTSTGPNQRGREEVQKDRMEIDLSKSVSTCELPLAMLHEYISSDSCKIEEGKQTTEKILVAGQTFNCTVTHETLTTTINEGVLTVVNKTWKSKAISVAGITKQEIDLTFITKTKTEKAYITMMLVAFGNDPEIPEIQCSAHVKQIGLALHNYHDKHNAFPPLYTVDEEGNQLHSWRVLILPYVKDNEYSDVYKKIRLDEPWDSDWNRLFHDSVPLYRDFSFRCPAATSNRGDTNYYMIIDDSGRVVPESGILFSERKEGYNWMDPNHEIRWSSVEDGINLNSNGITSSHNYIGVGAEKTNICTFEFEVVSISKLPQ